MKFIFETPAEKINLTLEHVEINQFFVTANGDLCQKTDRSSYNMIASHDGTPYADYYTCSNSIVIERILPKVVKIEF